MTQLINKVISLKNKKTSLRLAKDEWEAIDIICKNENIKRNYLIELINETKSHHITLTNSIRVFTIIYFYSELIPQRTTDQNYVRPPSISEAIHGII